MKYKFIIPLLILLLLVLYVGTPLGRILSSGIFKVIPPAHISSDLPRIYMDKLEENSWILIQDIHMIPMASDTLLMNHDMLIHQGIIQQIAEHIDPDSLSPNTRVIVGSGKYLIPGLADMHTHINDDNNLLLLLANGVTLTRNMSGLPFHLALKKSLENKEILGPELITTSPILEGPSSVWKNAPGSLRFKKLEEILPAFDTLVRYDEIKVYHTLSKAFWQEIETLSQEKNIRMVGHIPTDLSIHEYGESSQASFEHISLSQMAAISPELSLKQKFELLANKEKWICPTLIVNKYMFESGISIEQREEYARYVDPKTRQFWKSRIKNGKSDYAQKVEAFRYFSGKSPHILAGTDCINAFVVPGFSLHDELLELVESGLSPYEALRTSTYNPAKYLGRLDEIGTLQVGRKARAVILDENPLESIANTRKVHAVIMDGKVLSHALIDEMLQEIRSLGR